MTFQSEPISAWKRLPDGHASTIVSESRKCFEEEADRLAPESRFRMLAVQRALEALPDPEKTFDLEAVIREIRLIADGGPGIPRDVAEAARKAKCQIAPDSFLDTYISGMKHTFEEPRFNGYLRTACRRLGLPYEAVIGRVGRGRQIKYRLKRDRRRAAADETAKPSPAPGPAALKARLGEAATLMARRGWGDTDVGDAYRTARAVDDNMVGQEDSFVAPLRFDVGIGLWSHTLVRGDLESAAVEAARLADIAERHNDPSMRIVSLRASGTTALWLGHFVDAERDLSQCLDELGDGSIYRPFVTDLMAPPMSLVASDLADTLWVLGRYTEALQMIARARAQALAVSHPFHDCYSLVFSCWIQLKLGDLEAAAADAARLCEQARAFGLHALRALGRTLAGMIEAARADDPKDGLADMLQGVGDWQGTGSELLVCYFQVEAARTWLRSGDVRHAEIELHKALRAAERSGEGYYAAEMYRLRGEIEWQGRRGFAGAEPDLVKALELATEQRSPTFRLRAAMSLLGLSRARDDLAPARQRSLIARYETLLAFLCRSLDDQPDCTDLRVARSFLAGVTGSEGGGRRSETSRQKRGRR